MSVVKFMSPNRKSDDEAAYIKEVESRVAHLKTVRSQLDEELRKYERILQLSKVKRVSDG